MWRTGQLSPGLTPATGRLTLVALIYNPLKTRVNQHNSDITTLNEEHKGTTLSAYVRSLIRDSIPYSIKWDVIKRAAPYNPITITGL